MSVKECYRRILLLSRRSMSGSESRPCPDWPAVEVWWSKYRHLIENTSQILSCNQIGYCRENTIKVDVNSSFRKPHPRHNLFKCHPVPTEGGTPSFPMGVPSFHWWHIAGSLWESESPEDGVLPPIWTWMGVPPPPRIWDWDLVRVNRQTRVL